VKRKILVAGLAGLIMAVVSVYAVMKAPDVINLYNSNIQVLEIPDVQYQFPVWQEHDKTSSPYLILVRGGQNTRCRRCGGRGFLPCSGLLMQGCTRNTDDGCSRCNNTGTIRCPGGFMQSCPAASRDKGTLTVLLVNFWEASCLLAGNPQRFPIFES